MTKKLTVTTILKNPIFIFSAMGFGIYLGINFPDFSKDIKVYGEIYLNLLKLTVLPVLITVIVSSIAGLVRSPQFKKILSRMLFWFFISVLFCAGIGALAGVIGRPGSNLTESQSDALADLINTSQFKPDMEVFMNKEVEVIEENRVTDFLMSIIPENIFSSLNNGDALQVVFFSILLGVSIGMIKRKQSDFLINIFDGLFQSFQNIIGWIMLILPFGLICLLADQAANTGITLILAMLRFIVIFYIIGFSILIGGTFIIWFKSGQKFSTVLKGLSEPVMVAISTKSSLATLPFAISVMSRDLKFDKETTNLFIPLGQTLGRYGNIIFFAFSAVFVAQLYSYELSAASLALIIVGAILAGVSTAGATGFATLSLLTVILSPLKLPVEAVLLIFMSIDTIIDPMRTLLIVFVNLVATSFIAKPNSYDVDEKVPGVILQNIPSNINIRNYFKEFEGEIPIIELKETEFLAKVFPNANFKMYKSWINVSDLWSNSDVNIVIGEKEAMKVISHKNEGENKFVVLNKPK